MTATAGACAYCAHPIECYMPWDTHAGEKVHEECHTAIRGGRYLEARTCWMKMVKPRRKRK